MKIEKFKTENHVDISSFLSKLAEVESNNNKNELSIYCKFLSEKNILASANFHERINPENSFTMRCGLQLCNNRTSRHENIRKNIPFILLPKKNFDPCE